MEVTIIYSLPTKRSKGSAFLASEYDTFESALEVALALRRRGLGIKLLAISEKNYGRVAKLKTDLVFNLIEWTGADLPLAVKVFRILEKSKIPFTGATATNYLITSDKYKMKQVLLKNRLPTPDFQYFHTGHEKLKPGLRFPLLVKLTLDHCSIGLDKESLVHTPEELKSLVMLKIADYHEPVIAEEFLPGRELQVTVINTFHGPQVLPAAEIKYLDKKYKFLTYKGRWEEGHNDFKSTGVVLARLKADEKSEIRKIALRTFSALRFRDYARLDMRADKKGRYKIMEINSNPGLGDNDEYGMTVSYRAVNWSFADFIWEIVKSAGRRNKKLAGLTVI